MANDAITFYWRPGCGFCMGLERQLGKQEIPLDKRNIWDDPEAADFVRSHANGNETVPTVQVGSVVMVNPSPAQVLQAMEQETPELIPEGVEVPEPGRVVRLANKLLGG
jgi:mycoredoxin